MPERPVAPHDHTRFSRGGKLTSAAVLGLTTTPGDTSGGGTSLHSSLTGLSADDHTAYATVTAGGGETISTVAATGATETADATTANIFDWTLTANCTITLTGATAAVGCGITLILRQDGTGSRTVTWPGSVVWPNGTAPTLATAAAAVNVVALFTTDGGTVWYGFHVTGGAISYATPAIVLGTAAAAGAATTVIRSDSTIVAFDATVPTTAAAADAAATGSVAFAARRDHRHGMPSSMGGIGELVIVDSPSTPLIFADLVQNEAQDDLVYADP
jgi:hypothetical protein